jgi:hypothetical protein
LLCALHNKIDDKQKFFAKWVGYLFPVALSPTFLVSDQFDVTTVNRFKHRVKFSNVIEVASYLSFSSWLLYTPLKKVRKYFLS